MYVLQNNLPLMDIQGYQTLLANRDMSKMNYLNCMTLVRVVTKQNKWSDVTHQSVQETPQNRDNQDVSKDL